MARRWRTVSGICAQGVEIDRVTLVERLQGHDAVLLGEVHDNAEAHNAQGALVRLLEPKGLAVEMIKTSDEAALNGFLAEGGSTELIGQKVGWAESGWPEWAIYAPVFRYWKPGVLTGAALPRAEVRRSMTDGAAAIPLNPPMHALLEQPLSDAAQASIEAEMVEAHCGHLPKSMAPGMVQAQRLRDAAQAAAILRARSQVDGMVALIAGIGHTRQGSWGRDLSANGPECCLGRYSRVGYRNCSRRHCRLGTAL